MLLSQKFRNTFSDITFKDIIESISGTEQDFTEGKLGRALLLIAIPMVLEMFMESIFALVDIYFVSGLGPSATATVGITESIMTIIYAIAVGISAATTAIISRRIGEKNKKEASKSAVQAIIITVIVSIAIAIPGVLFTKNIFQMMKASDEIIANNLPYPTIMIGGNTIIMLLFVINAVFRSSGDAAISFRVLLIANLLNIILDRILIFGLGPIPAMGIKGAAIATNIGRGLAVLYQLYLLFYGKLRIQINWQHLKVNIKIIIELIKLSLGGIGQHIIATASWVILIRILTGYGDDVVAGYTVGIRIVMFSILPSWGLSNAASTLVGQNLGAKKAERAERSIWMCTKANIIFLGIISIVLVIFPDFFINLLVTEEAKDQLMIPYAITALRIISYGFIMYGIGMVMMQSINGSGDTKTPTLMNFVCYWVFEVPVAFLLAHSLNIGPNGVYISILLAESLLTGIGYIIIKRGKWKYNIV